MGMWRHTGALTALIGTLVTASIASADAELGSREYKLMLTPSSYNGTNPLSAVSSLWATIKPIVDSSTGLKSGGVHRYSGSFALDKTRAVRFFDSTGSGACLLNKNNYVFRERVPMVGSTEDTSKREVTLKYRDPDLYISAKRDMDGSEAGAETKFEEDIAKRIVTVTSGSTTSRITDTKPSIASLYAISTTEPISASKNLNDMDDPLGLFPDFGANLTEDGVSYSGSTPLVLVSGLEVYERVYKGGVIDLGGLTAELSVTLWYNKAVTSYSTPLLAELSFKYESSVPADEFTRPVVWRAKQLFLALQALSQVDATRATKTAFVYDYANHCAGAANAAD